MMKMPKLYAVVHRHEYGVSVKLFLYSPTKEMPMPSEEELVRHLKIDFDPGKGESLDICDANDMTNIDEELGRVDTAVEERRHQYHLNDGAKCLFCRSATIEGESFEVTSGLARRYVRCPDCGARWRDVYGLVGVEEITRPTAEL